MHVHLAIYAREARNVRMSSPRRATMHLWKLEEAALQLSWCHLLNEAPINAHAASTEDTANLGYT